MNPATDRSAEPAVRPLPRCGPDAPLIRAPEKVQTVFRVTALTACLPLLAGVVLFGWRALMVAAVSVASCALFERFYFRLTHTPSLLGRSHAYLTGLLLALTLPAFTPWYVVVLAAGFAILIGKAVFGGVGHFLWCPALVGRFAVAVMMPVLSAPPSPASLQPTAWPVLGREYVIFGDVLKSKPTDPREQVRPWQDRLTPEGAEAAAAPRPADTLARLTREKPAFSAIAYPRDDTHARAPTLLSQLPPIGDMLFGAHGGGIGETSIVVLLVGGLYLMYRNYVKWHLPAAILLSAAAVAAIAPIQLAGPSGSVETVWCPICHDVPGVTSGLDVGMTYVLYQVLSGGLVLGAFFLAPEMTSRPVTAGGQVIFGIGCGAGAMLLKLYLDTSIPAYIAILTMNTLTPAIDLIWRPRVFGQKHFAWAGRR